MILIKNGLKQELTDQTMIDAFLNCGWEPVSEPAPAPKEEAKAPAPKKAPVRRK